MKISVAVLALLSAFVLGCSANGERPRIGAPNSTGTAPPGACEVADAKLPSGAKLEASYGPQPEAPRTGSPRGYACVVLTIDAEGRVSNVELVSSDNAEFARSLQRIAKHWRFEPILVDGEPTAVRTVVTSTYRHL
jgi:TonB family protein